MSSLQGMVLHVVWIFFFLLVCVCVCVCVCVFSLIFLPVTCIPFIKRKGKKQICRDKMFALQFLKLHEVKTSKRSLQDERLNKNPKILL